MGGYLFLNSKGKQIWRLNLGGAIVWYGLLEERAGENLSKALLEQHNWGEVWDAAGYRELSQNCIRFLTSSAPLPAATESYRVQRKEPMSEFRANALRIFRGSMRALPRAGRFISADDLSMDWFDEPCTCRICHESPRPNPRALAQRYASRPSRVSGKLA